MSFSGARIYAVEQEVSNLELLFGEGFDIRYDTDGYASSPVSPPARLTAPADGIYRIGLWVYSWGYGDDFTNKNVMIRRNGDGFYLAEQTLWSGAAELTSHAQITVTEQLDEDDYLEFLAYVNPATTGTHHSAKGYQEVLAEAWITRIRAL